MMRKVLQVAIVIVLGLTMMFGFRWYRYVAHAESPYDEVGITLNGYVPAPLRQWGCRKMHARFAGQVPPYGCASPDGLSWI